MWLGREGMGTRLDHVTSQAPSRFICGLRAHKSGTTGLQSPHKPEVLASTEQQPHPCFAHPLPSEQSSPSEPLPTFWSQEGPKPKWGSLMPAQPLKGAPRLSLSSLLSLSFHNFTSVVRDIQDVSSS